MVSVMKIRDLTKVNIRLGMNRVGRMAQIKEEEDMVNHFREEGFYADNCWVKVSICHCLCMD